MGGGDGDLCLDWRARVLKATHSLTYSIKAKKGRAGETRNGNIELNECMHTLSRDTTGSALPPKPVNRSIDTLHTESVRERVGSGMELERIR